MIFLVLISLGFLVLGCVLGYFLNIYLLGMILLALLVCASYLFWELKWHPSPPGTSGDMGFAFLFLWALVLIAGVLGGLVIYYLPWNELSHRISSINFSELLKNHILR